MEHLKQFQPNTFVTVQQLNELVDRINLLQQEVFRLGGEVDPDTKWVFAPLSLAVGEAPKTWELTVDGEKVTPKTIESSDPTVVAFVDSKIKVLNYDSGGITVKVTLNDGRAKQFKIDVKRDYV